MSKTIDGFKTGCAHHCGVLACQCHTETSQMTGPAYWPVVLIHQITVPVYG